MRHTFGSLFAGVGGFDMGFEQAGWDCRFQVEWDKHCQSILKRHWPDVPKWGDVSATRGHLLPPVDCIIFGSPCQDLSVAGKRAGLQGERSGLFHEAMRVIKEMRDATDGQFPRWIVWENVAGAFSSNRGADFGTVIDEMAEAGAMVIEWALLDAQHFGVPQRRRRVFVVACLDPSTADRCPDPLLPVSESLRRDTQTSRETRQATTSQADSSVDGSGQWWNGEPVADTLTTKSDQQRMPDKNKLQAVVGQWAAGSDDDDILRTSVTSKWSKGSGGPSGSEFYNMVVGTLAARDHKGVGNQYVDEGKVIVQPVLFENSYRDGARIAKDGVTQTLSAKMGTGGGNTPMIAVGISDEDLPHTHALTASASKGATEDGGGRGTPIIPVAYSIREDAKANTFSATELDRSNALSALRPSPQSHHAQMFIAEPQMAVRRLTPIECERLMGWPDDHTRWTADGKEQADTHRYKQCGNGVASPVARWIAKHIKQVDKERE